MLEQSHWDREAEQALTEDDVSPTPVSKDDIRRKSSYDVARRSPRPVHPPGVAKASTLDEMNGSIEGFNLVP
jgi:hypothetical protein